jgi:hypothetical protein
MAIMVNAALLIRVHEVLDALAFIVLASTIVSGANYVAPFTRRAWASPARAASRTA